MYRVKIDANAATTRQVNEAEVCVSELEGCVSDDEDVTPQRPAIRLIKTAGTAANGAVFSTTAGPVTVQVPRHQHRTASAGQRHRQG